MKDTKTELEANIKILEIRIQDVENQYSQYVLEEFENLGFYSDEIAEIFSEKDILINKLIKRKQEYEEKLKELGYK